MTLTATPIWSQLKRKQLWHLAAFYRLIAMMRVSFAQVGARRVSTTRF